MIEEFPKESRVKIQEDIVISRIIIRIWEEIKKVIF
jgi:hypothetical protein